MHWKRRRPRWPYWVALGGLFLLTLAAPWSWHRTRSARLRAAADAKSHAPEAAPAPPKKPAKPLALLHPTVPPLAAPTAPEPELSGPMVFADDYVAVDEPLVEQKETEQEVAAAEPFSLRAKNRSVLIKNTAPPAAPSIFTKQSLTKVRDAILAMVEQARQAQAAQAAGAAAVDSRPTVRSRSPARCASSSRASTIAWR